MENDKIDINNLEIWKFGNTDSMIDELSQKTKNKKNRATCSLLKNKSLIEIGLKACVQDSKNNPICIVEVDKIEKVSFKNVGINIARAEGYSSVKEWKYVHFSFFKAQKENFSEENIIVCCYFSVVHIF